jgi:aminoglycoside phosphotransferase (APT) family kinase protein
MYRKDLSEEAFRKVAKYFLRDKKDIKSLSLNRVPDHHSFTRILQVQFVNRREERFVVKILKDGKWNTDKSVADILHEIAIQKELNQLGFTTRNYLFVESSSNNPIGIPFSVSTCLEGTPLSTMSVREIAALIPKVLDILYNLHSKTISISFGYSLKPKERYTGKGSILFGDFESKYLLADIKRYNIRFDEQEKKDLMQAINFLNETDQFSLCHCDATLSNIIWDGSNICLIDWTYSHFTEPTYDIAYLIFWLLELKLLNEAQKEIERAFKRYQKLGLEIAPRFLFYLAQKYIEFGRFKGVSYIKQGKQLLKEIPSKSLEDLLSSITKISQKTL